MTESTNDQTVIDNDHPLKIVGLELPEILQIAINTSGIKQGIVGIHLPRMGTVEEHEFLTSLFYLNQDTGLEQQVVVLPAITTKWFSVDDKEQMDALARRVERDKLDGVRYNRVFIALYNDTYPDKVKAAHDVWIEPSSYHEAMVFFFNKK